MPHMKSNLDQMKSKIQAKIQHKINTMVYRFDHPTVVECRNATRLSLKWCIHGRSVCMDCHKVSDN